MDPIILHTERLILCSTTPKDAKKRLRFYKNNLDYFGKWGPKYGPEVLTLDYHTRETEREYLSTFTKRHLPFNIYLKDDDKMETIIGNYNFSNMVLGHFMSCYLGYKMGSTHIGKGYMTEALEAGIDYLFNTMKMHRIEANIMPVNIASISVVKKLNFQQEGFSPKYLQINGKWEDHERWCLLNDDL